MNPTQKAEALAKEEADKLHDAIHLSQVERKFYIRGILAGYLDDALKDWGGAE